MDILGILEKIGSDSKRSHKIAIIQSNKENQLFRDVLTQALNPYINFHVRKIPAYIPSSKKTLEWALDQLSALSERRVTGHAGIQHLANILSSLSANDAIVIERIIGKDLRCGAGDGTVNVAIPDFIPTYPCLLARAGDAKALANITYPAYSQLKADGLRVNIRVEHGKVEVCGRSGRDIDLLGHLDAAFIELASSFGSVVFDGELIVVNDQGKIIDRKTGNGIINKAIKGTITPADAKNVRVQLWDAIPFDEFVVRKSKEEYSVRFAKLEKAITLYAPIGEDVVANKLKGITHAYWMVPTNLVVNEEEAIAHFEEMLAAGNEGTIIKNLVGLWEDTRSKHLVKMKAEKTADLKIVGFNPGKGKFVGMVGSLNCESEDGLIITSISGMSDAMRLEVTKNINSLINTVVEVTYNERIRSKTRTTVDSLFLPRLSMFRPDKANANSSEEII